ATPRPSTAPQSSASGTRRCIAVPSVRKLACLIRWTECSSVPPQVSVPSTRDATLKKAEKLLRQGKLAGAIAEYVRLVEELPRDWNSINALGDLYVRAGDVDRAVAQFTAV